MKSSSILLFFISVFISASAQVTETIFLSGTDMDDMVQWDFYCTNGMNSGKWSKIGVPSNWELQGFGTYLYGKYDSVANEKGMYRYEFTVPKNWQKKAVFIVFEGSMTDTEVKINGKSAGPVHQGAFYRFKYDISSLLNYGGKNLLEVTVCKESANESINLAERRADYWIFGGIFRPVYLEAFPVQYIDRVAIDARADGSFYMDVFLAGEGKATNVTAQLQTTDGILFGDQITSSVFDNKAVLEGLFPDAALWNPESPNLYQVEVSIVNGKKTIHKITQKFGFRTVEVRPSNGIYVNGTKILFKGVCRHTFWPSSGRTSSKKLAIDDVSLMKDMNMNAVRMSHYPPDRYFLDVCDSMGMFVLNELAGWQDFYDTPIAKRLVRQMVERDVNHPSIVLWVNGNEGGFNEEVRGDYALYDPQKRTVIEPWSKVNGTDTKHYPKFSYVENALNTGKDIFFPTEFLHGLNDGGLGAGLDDQWKFMMSKPLSAGAFLWVFADEGVERRDKNDSIDVWGSNAPDGILGPYHEKEGSFYTVKEIWAPVQFEETVVNSDFDGNFTVKNMYLYSNLKLCRFSYELVRFGNTFPDFDIQKQSGEIPSPDIGPGSAGKLSLNFPAGWDDYDVLYITSHDQYGRNINTWSWNITKPSGFALRIAEQGTDEVRAMEKNEILTLSSGRTSVSFNMKTGLITDVLCDNQSIPFGNGFQTAGFNTGFKLMRYKPEKGNWVIDMVYDSLVNARWTMMPGGILRLDYQYIFNGSVDFAGITFSYPESLVTGARLLADGPYRVWKNRLKGPQFGFFEKKYNNTVTGQSWIFPEFKGYYSNFYAVEIETKGLPFTIVSATEDLYLHLFTPQAATNLTGVRGEVDPPFPSGDISILHGISAIGTKFSRADQEGPQGQKNVYRINSTPLKGTLYFKFGK
ncbi:MAG: glycoside hydrolase family 2 [Bacteroidales bacterium]|nr:glycoside hydrolase family 2 [Bacteroidales bacterium]